jgi:hypothetical protein
MMHGRAATHLLNLIHEKEIQADLEASNWTSATVGDRSVKWEGPDGPHTLTRVFRVTIVDQAQPAVSFEFASSIWEDLHSAVIKLPDQESRRSGLWLADHSQIWIRPVQCQPGASSRLSTVPAVY